MLDSERFAKIQLLVEGAPVPGYDGPLDFWTVRRQAPSTDTNVLAVLVGPVVRIASALANSNEIELTVAEFEAADGRLLYAEFDEVPDVHDHGLRSAWRLVGWPEVGGVVALQRADGTRLVAHQPVQIRKPRKLIAV